MRHSGILDGACRCRTQGDDLLATEQATHLLHVVVVALDRRCRTGVPAISVCLRVGKPGAEFGQLSLQTSDLEARLPLNS